MKQLIVKNSIEINASSSKVWEIITKPEFTKQYMFDCELVSDWKVGDKVVWVGVVDRKVYVKGNLLKIDPSRFLQFTVFDPNMDIDDTPSNYSTVTYELLSQNDHTTVSVSQGDFSKIADGEKRYNDTVAGWNYVLPKIKELAEK